MDLFVIFDGQEQLYNVHTKKMNGRRRVQGKTLVRTSYDRTYTYRYKYIYLKRVRI